MQLKKISFQPTQSGKHTKQTCKPPFGGILALQVVSVSFVSASEVPFFGTWKRALLAKVPVLKCQKLVGWCSRKTAMYYSYVIPMARSLPEIYLSYLILSGTCRNKKRRPLLNANIPEKWWITFLFCAFNTLIPIFLSVFTATQAKTKSACFTKQEIEKCKKTN